MKTILITLLAISSVFAFGQDSINKKKRHEVGITLSDLNSFGLTYRLGKDKALWRFNTVFGEFQKLSSDSYSYLYGGSIGREWRKNLTENLLFRYGSDIFSINERAKNRP